MRAVGTCLLAAVLLAPAAVAHDAHRTEGMDDQLLDAGQGLMVGSFDAPQQGPLVVVPHVEGPIDCDEPAGYVLPVNNRTGVSFAVNATHLVATIQAPDNMTGYVGVGIDSASAIRTIMMMLEHAVAMHHLGAYVVQETPNGTRATFESGRMGVPYLFPDSENASVSSPYFVDVPMPGDGIRMDYGSDPPTRPCGRTRPGHLSVAVARRVDPKGPKPDAWRESLRPGTIVHGVIHVDPEVPYALPRPVKTTDELQVNLYLTRADETAERIQSALDPHPDPARLTPVVALAVGMIWVGRRRS